MIKKIFAFCMILIFLVPLVPASIANAQSSSTYPYPKIDGFWSPGEWPSSIIHTYDFNNLLPVQFGYRINQTDIIMTMRYQDNTPSFYGKSCAALFYKICSDGIAVGFDINGDQAYMGTKSSPDDAIFVGIQGNYSIDAYMQGIGNPIVYDTQVGGVNNTFGRFSYNFTTHYYTYEMVKALKSGDTLGHDIELNQGNSIYVMLAYWDNLPPRTEISGYSQWIKITITDPLANSINSLDAFIPIFIAGFVAISLFVITFGINKGFLRK